LNETNNRNRDSSDGRFASSWRRTSAFSFSWQSTGSDSSF